MATKSREEAVGRREMGSLWEIHRGRIEERLSGIIFGYRRDCLYQVKCKRQESLGLDQDTWERKLRSWFKTLNEEAVHQQRGEPNYTPG